MKPKHTPGPWKFEKHYCVPWRGRDGNLGKCIYCNKQIIKKGK